MAVLHVLQAQEELEAKCWPSDVFRCAVPITTVVHDRIMILVVSHMPCRPRVLRLFEQQI